MLIRNNNIVSLIPAPEESGKAPEPKAQTVLTTGYRVDQFSVSPDGKWVAYMSEETGRPEINVAAFPAFTDRRQISTAVGLQPLWRADGKELFFLGAADRKMMAVDIKSGAKLETGPVRELFQSAAIPNSQLRTYAVTRDGQRFLVMEPPGVSNTTIEPLYVISNWPALVK